MLHQHVSDLCIHFTPCSNDLIITLIVSHKTLHIELSHLFNDLVTLCYKLILLLWDEDIVKVEAETSLEGHLITEILDLVQEECCTSHTASLDHIGDDLFDGFLAEGYVLITNLVRDIVISQDTTWSCLYEHCLAEALVINTYLNDSVHIYFTLVESDFTLLWRIEYESLTLSALALFGDIIETQNHIL